MKRIRDFKGLLLSGPSEHTSFSSAGGATTATDETQPFDIMGMPMPVEPLLSDAPAEKLDELPAIMPGAAEDPSAEDALAALAGDSAAAPEQPDTEVFTESNSEATPDISIDFCVDDL